MNGIARLVIGEKEKPCLHHWPYLMGKFKLLFYNKKMVKSVSIFYFQYKNLNYHQIWYSKLKKKDFFKGTAQILDIVYILLLVNQQMRCYKTL